jgi:YidC/Oxa1 family membrane protein insertase
MFLASWFEVFIIKPIFNLLVVIYGLLPGHNFGLAIIVFTIVVRFLMWPLLRKQLHQAKVMKELQPKIKKIKQSTKGNRQQESMLIMELYKEKGISPFGSIGVLLVQLVILIGLYSGLKKVVDNPQQIIDYSYTWVQNLPWLKQLATDISLFDATLFGVVDLSRAAKVGSIIYWPAMLLVLGSALAQFFQSKQLMPSPEEGRKLKDILKEANTGKQADVTELNTAMSSSMKYILPFMIVLFTVGIASALSLYWLVGGVVAYIQQSRILKKDEQEMENIGSGGSKIRIKKAIDAEVVSIKKPSKPQKPSKANGSKKSKKRKK